MLRIHKRKTFMSSRIAIGAFGVLLLAGGGYLLSLVAAPVVAPVIAARPIDVQTLPAPTAHDNRIIIPKIGVNIPYEEGTPALDRGAQWRHPDRGNPANGGNFIIAAHRFSIQPTPAATVEKSPFYNIDKIGEGDKIIVDYEGKRYAYQVEKSFNVTPTQIEIEAPSDDARLTLYSCTLSGSSDGRVVLVSKKMGEVAVN